MLELYIMILYLQMLEQYMILYMQMSEQYMILYIHMSEQCMTINVKIIFYLQIQRDEIIENLS